MLSGEAKEKLNNCSGRSGYDWICLNCFQLLDLNYLFHSPFPSGDKKMNLTSSNSFCWNITFLWSPHRGEDAKKRNKYWFSLMLNFIFFKNTGFNSSICVSKENALFVKKWSTEKSIIGFTACPAGSKIRKTAISFELFPPLGTFYHSSIDGSIFFHQVFNRQLYTFAGLCN